MKIMIESKLSLKTEFGGTFVTNTEQLQNRFYNFMLLGNVIYSPKTCKSDFNLPCPSPPTFR